MKTYFVPFLCSILFLFGACKKTRVDDPFVQGGSNGERIQSEWSLPITSEDDLRLQFDENEQTVTIEIGEYNFYSNFLEKVGNNSKDITYDVLRLTEIKLFHASFNPYPFDDDTWDAFLKDIQFIYTPINGDDPVILSSFQDMPPEHDGNGDLVSIPFEQNLVELFANNPGVLSMELSFFDKPNDEIKPLSYTLYFSYKYETITY